MRSGGHDNNNWLSVTQVENPSIQNEHYVAKIRNMNAGTAHEKNTKIIKILIIKQFNKSLEDYTKK